MEFSHEGVAFCLNQKGGQANLTEIEKDKAIKRELKKLKDIFKNLPDNKKKLCSSLIDNAAFMAVTLKALSDEINAMGAVYEMHNGKQQMFCENPAQKSYNTMINRYTAVIKQLLDLLPESQQEATQDELTTFIHDGQK